MSRFPHMLTIQQSVTPRTAHLVLWRCCSKSKIPVKPFALAPALCYILPEVLRFHCGFAGVGVPSTKIDRMFEAFNQVQEGQVTGTGLGLFGVRQRAEGLNGTCGAQHNTSSVTGTGTVMWFAIPYMPDESVEAPRGIGRANSYTRSRPFDLSMVEKPVITPAAPLSPGRPIGFIGTLSVAAESPLHLELTLTAPSDLAKRTADYIRSKGMTAMVVDDTPTVRKLMERLLWKMGFAEVTCYENGSKGLDAMMAGQVDIVFSDVQMPIMTGPEVGDRADQ
jgi:CheY-like chemotaxis protein